MISKCCIYFDPMIQLTPVKISEKQYKPFVKYATTVTGLCLESEDASNYRMCHSDSYSDIGCAAVLYKEGCRFIIGIGVEIFPGDRCGDQPNGPGKFLDIREHDVMDWIKEEIKHE